jgi:hypothetical protein
LNYWNKNSNYRTIKYWEKKQLIAQLCHLIQLYAANRRRCNHVIKSYAANQTKYNYFTKLSPASQKRRNHVKKNPMPLFRLHDSVQPIRKGVIMTCNPMLPIRPGAPILRNSVQPIRKDIIMSYNPMSPSRRSTILLHNSIQSEEM